MAAFAAEALTWKRDLAATRTALAETLAELEHHIALATASSDAAGDALQPGSFQPMPFESHFTQSEHCGTGEAAALGTRDDEASNVDPLDAIFEMTLEPAQEETDAEVLREQRVAAAAANLWKRRGVLTPQE